MAAERGYSYNPQTNSYIDLSGRTYQGNATPQVTPQNMFGQLDQGARSSSNPSSLSLNSELMGATPYAAPNQTGQGTQQGSGNGTQPPVPTMGNQPSKNDGQSDLSRGKGMEAQGNQSQGMNAGNADNSPTQGAKETLKSVKEEAALGAKEAGGSPEANQLQQLSQSAGQQGQQLGQMNKLDKQAKKTEKASAMQSKIAKALTKVAGALEKAGSAMEKAGQAMRSTGQALLSNPFTAAIGAAMIAAGIALMVAGKALQVAGKAMKKAAEAIEKVAEALSKVAQKISKQVSKLLEKFNKALATISKKVKELIAKIRKKNPQTKTPNETQKAQQASATKQASTSKTNESGFNKKDMAMDMGLQVGATTLMSGGGNNSGAGTGQNGQQQPNLYGSRSAVA